MQQWTASEKGRRGPKRHSSADHLCVHQWRTVTITGPVDGQLATIARPTEPSLEKVAPWRGIFRGPHSMTLDHFLASRPRLPAIEDVVWKHSQPRRVQPAHTTIPHRSWILIPRGVNSFEESVTAENPGQILPMVLQGLLCRATGWTCFSQDSQGSVVAPQPRQSPRRIDPLLAWGRPRP